MHRPRATDGDSLRHNRDLSLFLLGQGVSNLGDAITATALPLLVLALTHSGAQMGLVEGAIAVSTLVFGPVAGVVADRWNRRRILLGASIGLGLATSLIPLSALLGGPVLLAVYVATVPLGALTGVFGAAYTAALPRLVAPRHLARLNSYFEALESFAWIFGPGLAGLLVARIGAARTMAADAASFLLSAAAVLAIRRPLQTDSSPSTEIPSLRREILIGLTYIVHHGPLRALLFFWWLFRFVGAAFIIAVSYHVTIDRGLATSVLGLTISAYAAGSLAGTLLAGRIDDRPARTYVLIASAGSGASLLDLAVATTVPALLAGGLLFGLTEGFILVIYLTARARSVPNDLLGRIAGSAMSVGRGMNALGAVAGGLILQAAGGEAALLAMAASTLALTLVFSRLAFLVPTADLVHP